MSDGLRLLSAVLLAGSTATLGQIEHGALLDNEVTAYEFIRGHQRQYRELPSAELVQESTGVRLPVAGESLQFYLDKVEERHVYGLIRARFGNFREALTEKNLTNVADEVTAMARILRRHRSDNGQVVGIDEALVQVQERLLSIRGTGGISGVTTNWPRFDAITGGYQNADLITWVGRPSLGKTYVALRQAQKAHDNGESVVFVTTEMSIEQMARRYAALSLGINPSLLKTGNISTHLERRIRSLVTSIGGADRFKLFSVGMNAKVNSVEALCQEFRPSVVFIDGVYLLKPTEYQRNNTRTDRVTGVYDELKALTLEANVPFICTTQFNRMAGNKGKDGTLETIGYSDAIGTHSSIVVALKDGPTENPRHSRTFDFLKGREGETGTVAINFKFAPLDMEELTVEEEQQAATDTAGDESVGWMS